MKPLQGITVLDLSRVLAGPMATQILSELGAKVIKVERPEIGDETRNWEPRLPGGESAYFFAFNRGKRSVTINLKDERGQKLVRQLACKADVLIENFLPGDLSKFGLGYDQLSQENPQLIYLSNSGFGQTGPYRDRKGYDTVFQALSGVMALTGQPDGPPTKVGIPIADLASGLWVVIAILTGLIGRNSSGHGCHIDVAMLDVQVSLLTVAAAQFYASGKEPQRLGTEHAGRVPSAAYKCRDCRWIQISGSDQHWLKLCEVLELPDLAKDESLRRNAGRVANRKRVTAALNEAIARFDSKPLADRLRAADIPVGEVNSIGDILSDPHIVDREMVGYFDHPKEGRFAALRTPLRFTGFETPAVETPPLLGADTDGVLKDEIGLTDEQIFELKTAGVI